MLLWSESLFLGVLQTFIAPLKPVRRRSINLSIGLCYKATDIALGKRQNRIAEHFITGNDIDLSEYDLSSSESDTSSVPSSDEKPALAPTSEMQELMSAIRIGLASLFKTSIFIRNSASKDKRLRAAEKKPFDNGADISYIKDRYPLLRENTTLVGRLGEANARRRQYFEYCRDHEDHLSTVTPKDHSDNVKAQPFPDVTTGAPAETVRTAQTKPSLLADTEATAVVADEAAQARMLEMIEAPEAMSAVSFATSVAVTSEEELPFPPVPAEAEIDLQFACPYCCRLQEFKSEGLEYQWRYEKFDQLRGVTDLLQEACSSRS